MNRMPTNVNTTNAEQVHPASPQLRLLLSEQKGRHTNPNDPLLRLGDRGEKRRVALTDPHRPEISTLNEYTMYNYCIYTIFVFYIEILKWKEPLPLPVTSVSLNPQPSYCLVWGAITPLCDTMTCLS